MRPTQASQKLLITIIAPCRNEAKFIDSFCDAVVRQQLPPGWRMEVIIADGMSDDGTRERLKERCSLDPRLNFIDNPRQIVSTGLNECIRRAKGEIIARLDIHTTFAPDYLAQCISKLAITGADNVGGPWVALGTNRVSESIAAAFQCKWVIGGALSRNTNYEGEVDSVYLGCWKENTFEKFGLFDEKLIRNQDDEHNLRLRLGGGKIWQSNTIKSTYYPRSSFSLLFKQQMQYGYWRPFVIHKHGQPGSFRQLIPAFFVASVFFSTLAVLFTPWLIISLAAVYSLYLVGGSIAAAHDSKKWHVFYILPVVIFTFHVGYGFGTWRGLWDVVRQKNPSSKFTKITR